jgi:nucleoside 2-deoxyribosyltransferase
MKIYLAAALFSEAERTFNQDLAQHLRRAGHEVYLPQEHEQLQNKEGYAWRIFSRNLEGLDWADALVAVLEGADGDSGTAWECGYAFAEGKKIFGLRTDFRNVGPEEAMNLQIEQGCEPLASSIQALLDQVGKVYVPATSPAWAEYPLSAWEDPQRGLR